MNQDRTRMEERELDLLLATASSPPAPLGAESRLLKRVMELEAHPVPQAIAPRKKFWLAGLPLAASLAFGLFTGASGLGTDVASAEDADIASFEETWSTGLEEAELAAEEDLS